MTWESSDDVPVLSDYTHSAPLTDGAFPDADITILHSNDLVFHRFPGHVTNPAEIEDECRAWLPEIEGSPIRRVIHPTADSYGAKWTSIIAVHPKHRSIENVRRSKYLFDIETDIVALGREGRTLFVGRRGDWLWVGATNDDGTLAYFDRLPLSDDKAFADQCVQAIEEMLSTANVPTGQLLVFGDIVDKPLLLALSERLGSKLDPIQRFNPFHRVRSTLSQDQATDVLRRAHLLGTIVGAM